MSADLMQYFVGPVAGLVIALAVIYSLLYTRKLAPGYVAAAAEDRAGKVDAENERLNAIILDLHDTILSLSKLNAGMEERIKSLESQVVALTNQVSRLRKELGRGD